MNQPLYVLCQDCLRVTDYTDDRHQDRELCQCGGQWCGCPSCAETIRMLDCGCRGTLGGMLKVPIYEWDRENGVTKEKP